MSKYTTEVRYICENAAGYDESKGYQSVNDILTEVANDIIGDYPIFDENYRTALNVKILRHYYTREIGFETVGLWKLKLNTKLNEIMPYYNKMYQSELLQFNPLYDVDLTTKRETTGDSVGSETSNESRADNGSKIGSSTSGSSESKNSSKDEIRDKSREYSNEYETSSQADGTQISSSETNESNNSWNKFSDTPQGDLTGVLNNAYMSQVTNDTGSSDTAQTSDSMNSEKRKGSSTDKTSETNGEVGSIKEQENGSSSGSTDTVETSSGKSKIEGKKDNVFTSTEDYLEHVSGKRGSVSYSKLLEEYRRTFINIDMRIISELSDLFMLIW